ncbi:MAG: folylpolyglutamate synthase/dihydrofolate synthase family protein [Candidatus Omnitrophota bacterium]|nr:folylpolyglutamate synthase/dihydrofolate synthase family protein [Candidatus Omnitrophota bacterium]
MKYKDSVDYINSFINFEKIPKYQYASSFRLERMEAILEELDNPHEGLNAIHVAGSKGKGSTCAITAYILKEAGYKVGLYTSPHLLDFKERIRILDGSRLEARGSREFEGMISEEEFVELVEEVRPVAEKFREHKSFGRASFFEIVTACAFLYFKKQKVDAVVLETGLGGRLDATNVVMPLACGITNISLEHTDKLGNSLAEIAVEKAGIIKAQGLVVSGSQEKETIEVIRKVCKEKNAKLYEVGKDIKYSIVNSDENSQVFDLEGPRTYAYKNLELNLIGMHQVENAAISIGITGSLGDKFKIKESDIRKGLKNAIWPGRLQVISKNPYVILDGAHNSASISALISSVRKLFKYRKLISVFGISSDKDIKGISGMLGAVSDIIILTKAKGNPRATDIPVLRENFLSSPRHEARPGLEESAYIDEAMQKAWKLADKDDLILVTGSLFVVGEAMQYFEAINKLTKLSRTEVST